MRAPTGAYRVTAAEEIKCLIINIISNIAKKSHFMAFVHCIESCHIFKGAWQLCWFRSEMADKDYV